LRIAYVSDVIYPYTKGGSEKRIYEFSKRLTNRGHEVHIFCPEHWVKGGMLVKDGVIYHGVNFPSSFLNKGINDKKRSILNSLDFSLNLFRYLLKEKFDIIDCNQSPILHIYPSKLFTKLKKTNFIVTWFEVWTNYWYEYLGPLGMVGRFIEHNVMNSIHPDLFITISEYTKNKLISQGVSESDIQIVPNGVDYNIIQNILSFKEELDVIFVGRLIKAKRLDILIRAIVFLKQKFPKIKIGIVGNGPERLYLNNLVENLDLEQNVLFFGFINDFNKVVSLMKSSKVFVYPSAPEGGGSLSMIEANSCGLPTISTKYGALGTSTEIVRDGFNGLLIEELSPRLMAEKIGMILKDEQLRMKMSKNALIFSKQYDWETITDLLESTYNDLCQ